MCQEAHISVQWCRHTCFYKQKSMVTLIPVLSEKYSHNFMYQLLAACIWLSPRTSVSSTNKFYHDNISMVLSKSNLLFRWWSINQEGEMIEIPLRGFKTAPFPVPWAYISHVICCSVINRLFMLLLFEELLTI